MTGADDLRPPSSDELATADWLDSNGKESQPLAPPGVFHHFGRGLPSAFVSGGLRGARAAATLAPAGLEVFGTGLTPEGEDAYYRHTVDPLTKLIDRWTPTGHDVGAAGQTLNGFVQGLTPLIAGPEALIATSATDTGVDLTNAGATKEQAIGAGTVQAIATGVGLKIPPALGKTLATRVATGALGNLGVDVASRKATQAVLADNPELAQQYDVTGESSAVATLMGAVFGGMHHLGADGAPLPQADAATRDAVLAASNAEHFGVDTAPGTPRDGAAAVAHQDALATAIQQVLKGEPVDVAHKVDLAQFDLHPALAGAPDVSGYDAFRHALESGGRADARNPNSSALGLDQFTEGTWLSLVHRAAPPWAAGLDRAQLLELRADPEKSAEVELYLRTANAAALRHAGVPVDSLTLYAAHHFGPDRAVAFAKARGGTPVEQILTEGQIQANPYLKGMTRDEVIANWNERARRAGVNAEGTVAAVDPADAPNFGLGEFPRTLPDDHPLLAETAGIDTPERAALRADIVDSHFRDLPAPRELTDGARPVAYLMGGGGASGKGTLLASLQDQGAIPRDIVSIDPDHIKEALPEYRALRDEHGDSRAAAVVHEESSVIAGEVKARAMAEGRDLVLDRTLGNPAKARGEIQALKDAGYEVRLFGVTVDPAEAIRRAVGRAKKRGRYVPLTELLKAHKGFAQGFEDYVGLVDQARLYDNSGAAFHHLADAAQGKLTISDQAGYTAFARRRATHETASTYRQLEAGSDGAARVHPGADGQGPRAARSPGARAGREVGPQAVDRGARSAQGAGSEGLDPERFPAQGTDSTIVTERGLRLPVRWAVTEARSLVTSHDDALHVNPAFPAELQPRDRARAASEAQIARIANAINPELLADSPKAADGAPIVGKDSVVESGNARTIALRRAYATGKGGDYRAYVVAEAARFGLDPGAVDALQQPVLVRVTLGDYDRADFARQANESTVAAMSTTEQALADARHLPDLGGLHANDDGTLNLRASAKFVHTFIEGVGPNERAAMATPDGQLSQQGQARIRNAVFAAAYGDADLVAMLTESTDANVKNVLAGMLRAAPQVAKLREMIAEGGRYGPDITPDLTAAARKFSQLRSEGMSVEQFEAQGDFFGGGGLSPDARRLLRTIGENARAPKRMAEFLQGYVAAVDALGDPRQADLMGGTKDASAAVDTAAAATRAAHEAAPAPKPGGGLFNAAGRPTTEARAPVVTPDNRAAYEAIAAMPDLQVIGEDGVARPAAEFLQQAQDEAAQAAETLRGLEAAANCFVRNAA